MSARTRSELRLLLRLGLLLRLAILGGASAPAPSGPAPSGPAPSGPAPSGPASVPSAPPTAPGSASGAIAARRPPLQPKDPRSQNLDTSSLLTEAVLGFDPSHANAHSMSIGVAVYLEHLYHVDDRSFTFDADFYLIQRWDDARNYSALFADSGFLDTQACESGGGGGTQEESSIALGTTDGGLVWQPDVGLANVVAGASAYIRHAKQIRLYRIASSSSSGATTTATTSGGGDASDISYSYRFETVEFVFARLQMEPDTYHAFPFDSHALPIVVESHSQGVDRINITASTELTGLATDKTGTWPGWLYRMHDASVSRPQPGFTALSAAGGGTAASSPRSSPLTLSLALALTLRLPPPPQAPQNRPRAARPATRRGTRLR